MKRNRVILLVEDNDDDVLLFRRGVERSGCDADVCHCLSASAAMQHLDELRSKAYPLPSLAFVDLWLPNVRGTHLVTWMKQQDDCRLIPVIVLTGSAAPRTAADLEALGANAVMLKPTSSEQLVECIGAACTFWLKCCLRH
jgi:two-component system, response regulator